MNSPNASAQYLQLGSKLVGTGAAGNAFQGVSVSVSADGNTAIVGGFNDNGGAGAAWIFTRSGGVWTQQGSKLVGTGAVGNASQGNSVCLSADGNTAIVGGYADNSTAGAAWIFTRSSGVWTQQGTKLVGTGAVGNAYQGNAVALSADGNTAIVGGQSDNSLAGAVWIFTRSGGVWTQQGSKLVGTGAVGSANQGVSVCLSADGNTAIVGGEMDNSNAGAAWIFTRSGGVWTQQGSKLVGTGAVGTAFQGISASLSADGNTAILGGETDSSFAGAAWIFTRSGGVWTQQGPKLVGTGAVGNAYQGISVSLSGDGDAAIVGGEMDSSGAGAAWIFTRSGGAWTQEGSKIVGTGAVGGARQGRSVSLSADGGTAIVGGELDNSAAGAVWAYFNGQPRDISVSDAPLDQGGSVFVDWNRSSGDVPYAAFTTEYWVWRGVHASAAPANAVVLNQGEYVAQLRTKPSSLTKAEPNKQVFMNIRGGGDSPLSDIYWQYITSLPSHGLDHYSYACPTLADSISQGIPWRYFFITAATNDPALYWDSPVDSGYSVDNLSPGAVQTPGATAQAGPSVTVHWQRDLVDPDVADYEVYRSTIPGFTPTSSDKIGQTSDTMVTDNSPTAGSFNYYRVVTVDIHGNQSPPSVEAAVPISAVQTFGVIDNWNMVSVPLVVSDYSTTTLYPAAVSTAFAYQGSYVTQSTLTNGSGYWVRFNGPQTITMTGLYLTQDTITVSDGWNMIGSLSQAVPVSSISSVPPGIVTSQFFGYGGSYHAVTTIASGQGYWVKVNGSGKLLLSSSSHVPASAKVRIELPDNQPPLPPDQNGISPAERGIPKEYSIAQNYPNPFNPTTEIEYSLPGDQHVSLIVLNTLGQVVAQLVNRFEQAGYKIVSFDASHLPSGVYFYQIKAGSFTAVKKMLLLK